MKSTTMLLIGVMMAMAAPARAGGYAVAEQSATAGGTAGAATARSDDPGAAWYNPAALVDDGGTRAGAGVVLAMAQLHAAATDDAWQADTEGGATPVPQLHVGHAAGPWAIGLAAGVPYGGNVHWPADWQGRHEVIASRLAVVRLAPFAGWRFGRVRVAGGVHVDLGELRIRRGLDFVDTEGDVQLAMRGAGLGFDAAAFVRITDDLDAGVSYRSRTRLAMSGEADFTAPDAFSMKTADQHVTTEVALPDRIAAGVAWKRGALAVLGDVEVTAWSINDRQVIDFEREATPDVTQVNAWSTTVALRAGAEWRGPGWTARAGVAYDPSPAPDDHLAPTSPDSDRYEAAIGGTWLVSPGIAVDGFYALLHLAERESENSESMRARYGGNAHLIGVGVRWTR